MGTWRVLVGSLLQRLRRDAAVSPSGLSVAGAAALLCVALLFPAPADGTDLKFAAPVVVAALLWRFTAAMRRRGVLR